MKTIIFLWAAMVILFACGTAYAESTPKAPIWDGCSILPDDATYPAPGTEVRGAEATGSAAGGIRPTEAAGPAAGDVRPADASGETHKSFYSDKDVIDDGC